MTNKQCRFNMHVILLRIEVANYLVNQPLKHTRLTLSFDYCKCSKSYISGLVTQVGRQRLKICLCVCGKLYLAMSD